MLRPLSLIGCWRFRSGMRHPGRIHPGYICGRICYCSFTSLAPQVHTVMSYPTTHRSVTVIGPGKVDVQEKNVPAFTDEEILIRVRSVALNPLDWKASLL